MADSPGEYGEVAGELSTTVLVERHRQGDGVASDCLFARYYPLVRAVVRTWFESRNDPALDLDDLVQAGMLHALRKLPRYRSEGRFRAWLLQVVRNRALDLLTKPADGVAEVRRRGTFEDGDEGDPMQRCAAADTTPSQHAIAGELSERLRAGLVRLDDDSRMIVLMRVVGGVSHDEIARELNMTSVAVRKAYSRALARIGLRR